MARLAPAAPRLPAPRGEDAVPGIPPSAADPGRRRVPAAPPAEAAGAPGPPVRTRRQALAQERTGGPRSRGRRALLVGRRILLTAFAALLLAAAWVAGGPAAALLLAGAGLLAVGVQGLVRGRVRWAGIGARPTAAAATLCGLGLVTTGVALAPLPLSGPVTRVPQQTSVRPGLPTPATSHPGLRADTDALIATAAPGTALATLGSLPVRAEHSITGYRSGSFRSASATTAGCTVGQRVMLRDVQGARTTEDDPCEVRSGVLVDPYSGLTVPYLYAQPGPEVRLDFVVAPADAWRTGAAGWSRAERRRFASDPDNLLATAGRAGARPGRWDAASWLPPAASRRCPHVARQIAVKAEYGLWVTPPERAAMAEVLSSCPAIPGTRMS